MLKTSSASLINRVRIKNEGIAALNNIDVSVAISGANTFNQTINIAALAAGADQVIDFTGYSIVNSGKQDVCLQPVWLAMKGRKTTTHHAPQTVTNSFVQPMTDSLSQQTGIGFTGSSNNEIAIKIYGTGTRKISQIRVPFGILYLQCFI